MASVAQKVPFALEADAAGVAVDLVAFPTALTGVSYSVDNADVADVVVGDDGVAYAVGKTPGVVVVSVTGVNVNGDSVTGAADPVTFEAVVPVVDALKLTAGTPVAQ